MAAILWLLIGCIAVLGLFVFVLARDLTKLRRKVNRLQSDVNRLESSRTYEVIPTLSANYPNWLITGVTHKR